MGSGIALVKKRIRDFNRQFADSRHRVARVEGKIEDRRLELVGVGGYPPHACSQHSLDGDALAERLLEQRRHVDDEVVGIDRLGIEDLAAREREQPLRQACRAIRIALEHFKVVAHVGLDAVQPPLHESGSVPDHMN